MPWPSKRAFIALAALASALVACPRSAGADDSPSSAPLAVTVTPGTGGGPWKLKVENTGDVPVRIAADPRLLVLEVTPPAGFVDEAAAKKRAGAANKAADAKPVRCILPDDARPVNDEGRELVVPSKRSWSVAIDPQLYCFGEHERSRLVVGATVTARFGWPTPPKPPAVRGKAPALAPPFVAFPVGAAIGRVAPAKELVSAPFTLTETVSAAGSTNAAAPASPTLTVSLPESLDAARGNEISATVTVANDGDKALVLLLRPETVRLSVAGPDGSVSCGTTREIGSPIRELYSTLGVKGRATVSVLLTSICPAGTFDAAGIYRVTPMLDTSGASARSIGLKTWDGIAEGRSSMLLRVRTPRRPVDRVPRPSLD